MYNARQLQNFIIMDDFIWRMNWKNGGHDEYHRKYIENQNQNADGWWSLQWFSKLTCNCKFFKCFNYKKNIYINHSRHCAHINDHLTHAFTQQNSIYLWFKLPQFSNVLSYTWRTLKFFIWIQEGKEEYGQYFQHIHKRFGDFSMCSKRKPSISTSCNLFIWIMSNSSSS